MGGQAYLRKLAFGRSPYEPVEEPETDDLSDTDPIGDVEDAGYTQEHDRRGNPKNAQAAQRIEAQIAAKNEVLAAVGVCEKKNKEALQPLSKMTFSKETWRALQEAENSIGETGRMFIECVRHGASWWVIALRKRTQAGIVSSDQSFFRILADEWRILTSARGLRGAFRYFLAGAAPELAGQTLAMLLEYLIDEVHIRLCELPHRLRLRRNRRNQMRLWIDRAKVASLLLSQVILSPLAISAALQQLGLAKEIPSAKLLPWNPLSPLRWAFVQRADSPPLHSRTLSILLSPAILWSASNAAYQFIALNYGLTPFCPNSLIIGPEDHIRQPNSYTHWTRREAPTFLAPLNSMRDSILQRLGWSAPPLPNPVPSRTARRLEHIDDNNDDDDDDDDDDGDDDDLTLDEQRRGGGRSRRERAHRQTELAQIPSHLLALNLDSLISQLVFLPLESLFLRTLVSACVAGPLAMPDRVRFYRPGKGPLSGLVKSGDAAAVAAAGFGTWSYAGGYVNKIGLCLALQASIDMAVWAGAYAWTRNVGVERFSWGAV